jgi:DNA helicase II / ATP-dependent DNA helicase PcrA
MISEVDNQSFEIADLTEIFKSSRFKQLAPVDVEVEINLTRGVNTFVCKLDAVFEKDDRFEIVDWKTGAPPEDETEREQMTLQLALYRFAYSELRKIPLENIDVCFYFVKENLEFRPQQIPGPDELMQTWEELFS